MNRTLKVSDRHGAEIFIHDETVRFSELSSGVRILLSAHLPESVVDSPASEGSSSELPIILRRGNVLYVNCYSEDELILKEAFEAVYGRPARKSIMYGEGLFSQRLEISPDTRAIVRNRLERYSMNGYWELPEHVAWNVAPQDVPSEELPFVFGEE